MSTPTPLPPTLPPALPPALPTAPVPDPRRGGRVTAALAELAATLVALVAVGGLFLNKVDTMVAFFGETPAATPGNVSAFHLGISVLAVCVVVACGSAFLRRSRGGRATYWHLGVLVVSVAAGTLFSVSLPPV